MLRFLANTFEKDIAQMYKIQVFVRLQEQKKL